MKKMLIITAIVLGIISIIVILIFTVFRFTVYSNTIYISNVTVSDKSIDIRMDFVASDIKYIGYKAEYDNGVLYIRVKGTYLSFLGSSLPVDISIPNTYGAIKAIYLKGVGQDGDTMIWLENKTGSSESLRTGSATPDLTKEVSLEDRMRICGAIPNGETREVLETTRMFIDLPENIYPFKNRRFKTTGTAVVGYMPQGEGKGGKEFELNGCVDRYYDFGGEGTVDVYVRSDNPTFSDYQAHFIVKKLP